MHRGFLTEPPKDLCLFRPDGIGVRTPNLGTRGMNLTKTIYVGNLPWSATEQELTGLFSEYGHVEAIRIAMDRDTGRSRGFGFVEMDDENAEKAIDALNGKELDGRELTVNQAQERPARGR